MFSSLKQVLSEKFLSGSQREPEYNTALVHTGILRDLHANYQFAGAESQCDEKCNSCSGRIDCQNRFAYKVISGRIYAKRLEPVMVHSTRGNSHEGKLETYILYPKTETAVVEIRHGTNSPYTDTVLLRKLNGRGNGNMYRKEP